MKASCSVLSMPDAASVVLMKAAHKESSGKNTHTYVKTTSQRPMGMPPGSDLDCCSHRMLHTGSSRETVCFIARGSSGGLALELESATAYGSVCELLSSPSFFLRAPST